MSDTPTAPADGESTSPPALPDLPPHHQRPSLEHYVSKGYSPETYEKAMVDWEDELRRYMAAGNPYPIAPPEEEKADSTRGTDPAPPPDESVALEAAGLPAGHVPIEDPAALDHVAGYPGFKRSTPPA